LLMYGIGVDMFVIAAYNRLMSIAPKKHDAEYDATYNSFGSLGWTIGPLIGGFVLSSLFENSVFLFFTIFCVIAFWFVLFTIKGREKHYVENIHRSFKSYWKSVTKISSLKKEIKVSLSLYSLIAFWDGVLWMIVPLYFFSLNASPRYIGFMLTALTLPYLLFRIPAGVFEDKRGKIQVILPSLLLTGIALLFMAFTTNITLLILLAFVVSTGGAILSPAMGGLMIDNTRAFERSRINSLRSMSVNLAFVIAYIFAGIIAQYLGYMKLYLVLGIIVIVIGVVVKLVMNKNLKKKLKPRSTRSRTPG
jgi:MFS family permease